MLSARVRDQLRVTGRLLRLPDVGERLRASSGLLRAGFAVSLAAYLLLKLAGAIVDLPPLVDLSILPAGVCAIGLALQARTRDEEADAAETQSMNFGLLAAAVLVVFTITYLAVNTVPFVTSQDESAIVHGGHELATSGSLRVTSPLNDRYQTNMIGALHVLYRTPTDMYYRTFPGTAALYAPFSVLPGGLGYRLFTVSFGTLAIGALYFVARRLLGSWQAAFVAALAFAVSPAFGHWAVTVYNNVPVLALELCALAVALWAPRERTWAFGLAGALLSVAFFARVTEVVYVAPLFALVWWRSRSWRGVAALTAATVAGVALIGVTNAIFFHDALLLPHIGKGYLWLPASPSQAVQQTGPSSTTLLGRYAEFTGTSPSNAHLLDQIKHLWFHARYLASSTFAFPFLGLGLVGITWRAAAGRRGTWLLAGALLTAALAVLVIYGRESSNYYGYGQAIVRSSFVRYSLPVYAMLGLATGAFALEASRLFRGTAVARALPIALVGVILVAGVAKSYDADVYGFNRLNGYREDDRAAWSQIKPLLGKELQTPLLIGGPSSEKLIDSDYEKYFINYMTLPDFYRIPPVAAVAERASAERPVFLIMSEANAQDMMFQTYFYTRYQVSEIARVGSFSVQRVSFVPVRYTLGYVDVWNTYSALSRWAVTPEGMLQAVQSNAYIQLPLVDADGDGRVDQDVTVQLEVQDTGPAKGVISGIDSRTNAPVPLWQAQLHQTPDWLTVTVTLHQGDDLTNLLTASKGLTFRAIGIAAVGSP
jgi:hypothetical protein